MSSKVKAKSSNEPFTLDLSPLSFMLSSATFPDIFQILYLP